MTKSQSSDDVAMTRLGHDSATVEFQKKHHVIAKLGEGGMAVVHLAVVRGVAGVRKLVVLKSMRPELVTEPRMREMFLAEARLAATLNHPNLVQTYEVVIFSGRPVLVMEYLDGQPLSRILSRERRAQVPLRLQLFVLKEVLFGLDYLHNLTDLDGTPLGLVHRDVSPHNIFVAYDGHPKLLDFGIAKQVGSSGNTEAGMIKGKVRYMSPEQLAGSARLDRRADVFAIGVMLWEAITGRRLWEGMSDLQVMQNLVDGKVPPPASVAQNVPPLLAAICEKALATDCEARYESAALMQADLEEAIEELRLETSPRQVGKLVTDWFSDLRAATRKIIEAQLGDDHATPVNLVVSDESDVVAWADAAISGDLWGLQSSISATRIEAIGRRKPRRRRWLVAACVLAVAGVGSLPFVHRGRDRRLHAAVSLATPAAPAAPAAAGAPYPAAARPASVHVYIDATPPGARLYLDDAPLPGNPFEADLPSDSGRHSIRAEAPGYRPQIQIAELGEPLTVAFNLEAATTSLSPQTRPTTAIGHVARGAPAPIAASTSKAQKPASSSCGNPYYFDENGIKHVKPECL